MYCHACDVSNAGRLSSDKLKALKPMGIRIQLWRLLSHWRTLDIPRPSLQLIRHDNKPGVGHGVKPRYVPVIGMDSYGRIPRECGRVSWHDLFHVLDRNLGGGLAHDTYLANPLDRDFLIHARDVDVVPLRPQKGVKLVLYPRQHLRVSPKDLDQPGVCSGHQARKPGKPLANYCEIGARVRRPEEENASCASENLLEVSLRAGF